MPENRPADESWAEHLAADLTTPHFTITEWEAVGRRLRRNYLWIFAPAGIELEFKSLSLAVAGARLQRFHRSRDSWSRSRLDRFCSRHRVQCCSLYFRDRNSATA